MAAKVDEKIFTRIVELKTKYNLTSAVIAERLGISIKTVQVYLRAARLGLPVTEAYNCTLLKKS